MNFKIIVTKSFVRTLIRTKIFKNINFVSYFPSLLSYFNNVFDMLQMARTQKNKATALHLGILKARLAKLRRELITPKGGGGATGEGK